VTKQIACFIGTNALGAEICDTFGKLATGVQGDTQDPAFCYRISVTNCGQVDLTNVTLIDDKFGDLTTNLFGNSFPVLASGAGAIVEFKAELGGAAPPNTVSVVTNTAIASGQTVLSGQVQSAKDSAIATIIPAAVSAQQLYQVDGGGATNCVRLSD